MRRKVDSRTIWSLTAIRNGKQENAERIEEAQFCYGRWPDEVTRSSSKRLPSGLIGILGALGMEEKAMESGFVIYMAAAPSDRESWIQFVSTVTVKNSERSSSFDTRTLYSTEDEEGGTIELVDLYNPCIGGMRMPNKVWMTLGELPMSTLAWAIGSGVMDAEKSRQMDLSQWIGKPKDNTIIPNDIMSLPGPPSKAYTFDDAN